MFINDFILGGEEWVRKKDDIGNIEKEQFKCTLSCFGLPLIHFALIHDDLFELIQLEEISNNHL